MAGHRDDASPREEVLTNADMGHACAGDALAEAARMGESPTRPIGLRSTILLWMACLVSVEAEC